MFKLFLRLLPRVTLSRWLGKFMELALPAWLLAMIIKNFARLYRIDMTESGKQEFKTFNEFFTRPLCEGARVVDDDESSIVSPVDGIIGAFGPIERDTLIQAKGIHYPLNKLVMASDYHAMFSEGQFVTIYLSPRHYHRIHAPIEGDISEAYYIPGDLYPVNDFAVNNIDALFTKNERLITVIKHKFLGCVAVIKVGATIVGKIQVVYDSFKPHARHCLRKEYSTNKTEKGQELARFLMGSTVILLFEPNRMKLSDRLKQGLEVRWGEKIADIKN